MPDSEEKEKSGEQEVGSDQRVGSNSQPFESKKLFMVCKEHVWTSTFAGAHCPECSQRDREASYKQQFADYQHRSLDRRTKQFGISG